MARSCGFLVGWAMLLALATTATTTTAVAQPQVREFEENGIRYRETTEKVLRPYRDVRYEERERTVYRQEVSTETRDFERVVQTPVTEYRCEPYVRNRFGIFRRPCLCYHLVPRTRMETHTEIVSRPVTTRRYKPQQVVDRVRVVGPPRMVEETVTRRVAITPRAPVSPTRLSDRRAIIREPAPLPAAPTRLREYAPIRGPSRVISERPLSSRTVVRETPQLNSRTLYGDPPRYGTRIDTRGRY